MKKLIAVICFAAGISALSTSSRAQGNVVVVPLFRNKPIAGNAVPADVLEGKTFTTSAGEQEGIRPPAPMGTDYIGLGVPAPDPRFEVYRGPYVNPQEGYGVRDRMTGLIWRMSPENNADYFLYAKNNCEDLSTQYIIRIGTRPISVDDWRLPTVKELESLLDYTRGAANVAGTNGLVEPNYFTDILNGQYWTASYVSGVPCVEGSSNTNCWVSYLVDIVKATVSQEYFLPGNDDEPAHYSWCVRGPYGIDY